MSDHEPQVKALASTIRRAGGGPPDAYWYTAIARHILASDWYAQRVAEAQRKVVATAEVDALREAAAALCPCRLCLGAHRHDCPAPALMERAAAIEAAPSPGSFGRITSAEGKRSTHGRSDGWRYYFRMWQAAEGRAQAAEEALAELVRLKDGPRDAEYERQKPLAWEAARAVLDGRLL